MTRLINNHSIKTAAITKLVLFAAMIVVNALANMLPLNGMSTAEVSTNYPTLFAPAGITFAIWGVIYLLLLLMVIYQLLAAFAVKYRHASFSTHLSIALSLNFIFNTLWIFTWHYEMIFISMVLILLILLTLLYMYLKIRNRFVSGVFEYIVVKLPIIIYLGWISVATIANVAAFLVAVNFSGWGISESAWTSLLIALAATFGIIMIKRQNNFGFSLVLIWAFIGIIIKRNAAQIVYFDIIYTVWTFIGILIFMMLHKLWHLKKNKKLKNVLFSLKEEREI